MCDPQTILAQARAAGLRLRRVGDQIGIAPARLCPPDLAAQIRAVKPALIELLAVEQRLTADQRPWVAVAAQILAGEFDAGTRGELEAVWLGVRGIRHPGCQQARARLETLMGKKEARR